MALSDQHRAKLLEICDRASRAEHGIGLRSGNGVTLKKKITQALLLDDNLRKQLKVTFSPFDTNVIYIVRRECEQRGLGEGDDPLASLDGGEFEDPLP